MNALAALILAAVLALCAVGAMSEGRDGWGALLLVLAIVFGASGVAAAV